MSWKAKLKENVCTIEELKNYIDLSVEEEEKLKEVIKIHPMAITKYYLSLIDGKDKNDPIRKLIVPSVDELDPSGDYDPSGERENTKSVGLQHKYEQTALILSTNRCSTYCRFCFRKRLVGLPSEEVLQRFSEAVKYIKNHKEITNVLISGGDPFVLPTSTLRRFLEKLFEIDHLDFIRFGTRVPVAFPDRILEDNSLLDLLKEYSLKDKRIYVVTHFNHPKEITEKAIEAINKLIGANIIVSNQTVLLKGVNDDPEVLAKLLNRLVSMGVVPYYVFQCRPVKRVKSHFSVPLVRGYKVVEGAKRKLSGPSKRFRYVMSHRTGKIEIVGVSEEEIYFKYHQAKDPSDHGRFFKRKIDEAVVWLDDFEG